MMKALFVASAALALLALPPGAEAGKADDTLNVAFSAEVEPLDNYKIAGREGLILTRHVFDGLLYKDMDSGTFKPALATAWKFTSPTAIELDLRQGVTFHNGEAFDADDVVYTLTTIADPKYGTRYKIVIDWIKNVEKLDKFKVRINMSKAYAPALEMLADNLPIYPNEYFAQAGSQGMAAKPVGTGPYRLVEFTPGTRYVLERFDGHYAGSPKGKPAIKRIVVRTIPEANTQYAELLTGKLDWIWRVPPDQAKRLAANPAVQIVSGGIMRIGYVHFNVAEKAKKFPTGNVKVRQAIMHAVNRQAIIDAFVGGASKVVHPACNPAQFGCATDVKQYAYDPAAAKKLLAEAGFPNGLDIELMFAAMPRPQAEAIAADLGKVGIRVTLNEQQYAAAAPKWRAGEVPMVLGNWGSYGIGDVAMILGNFFAGGADDLVGDAEIKAWIDTGDTATDPAVRKDAYAKALKKIADNAMWMSLWDFNVNFGVSKDLAFKPYPDEFARFYRAAWK
ncbi:MAG: ABC transporter substrate-binding protein [Alphaproteobacteria bacterium]|nr:ABC transporter substrate-binding protein [Alphaproteobacteria bacterium]